MRLANVLLHGRPGVGLVESREDGDGWLVAFAEGVGSLDDVVRGGQAALDALVEARSRSQLVGLDEVDLLAPLSRFNRDILCTGWNYWEHFEESKAVEPGRRDTQRPDRPTFFTKAPGAVIGPYDDIAYDPELSLEWDYEAEIALVISRSCRSVPEAEAMGYVFGFAVANDVSVRDMQREHGGQWMKGKSVDATMPFGPWITTADEVLDPGKLRVTCEVNGTLLQDAMASEVAFSFPRIISELSRGMTLNAGDVILTGTPPGVGNARDPKLFLAEGDIVATKVSGLGNLLNRVARRRLT